MYRRAWDDARRRADAHLFWPHEPYRDDRRILVAGCGTMQAAHYALRWPHASVIGIDVSANSLAFSQRLKEKHSLGNLELRELPLEHVAGIGGAFDYIVCTGVLHHLEDPDAGLRALRGVLAPGGAMHVMVYAPYGRAGIYMLQEYCRCLGIGASDEEITDLVASLRSLPADHPLVPLLRSSPDFASPAGVADALLNPRDRAYSVPQLLEFLDRADLRFERWMRQAPYLPWCGALASLPQHAALAALPQAQQFAAAELFRGTMVRHAVVASTASDSPKRTIDFTNEEWRSYTPLRLPNAIAVRERLPARAAAVLINRDHTYTDLYLPIDAEEDGWLAEIDGERTIENIAGRADADRARRFFEKLWRWDQVVFDISRSGRAAAS